MFLSEYLKREFNTKVYKISLSSGCTCPNRDGKKGYGGCAFCSSGGSGDFCFPEDDIRTQVMKAKSLVSRKLPKSIPADRIKYIAYFQSFTNTYVAGKVTLDALEEKFMDAVSFPEVAVLSIGTRPDCLQDEVLDMLSRIRSIKPVWIELGLQTIHEETAKLMNRCYDLSVFENSYLKLKKMGFHVIVHVILGLPGETEEMMLGTVRYLSSLDPSIDGIKLQNLQVIRGTSLASLYEKTCFHVFSLEEYASLLEKCLEILPENVVIHRITGDAPKSLLIEPKWSAEKKRVMNFLKKKLGF